jgi:hypothetical protein
MSTDLKKLETLVGRLELITQRQEAFHSQKPGLAPKPAVSNNSSGGSYLLFLLQLQCMKLK